LNNFRRCPRTPYRATTVLLPRPFSIPLNSNKIPYFSYSCNLSALEALRNALYKCSTYLLTYLKYFQIHSATEPTRHPSAAPCTKNRTFCYFMGMGYYCIGAALITDTKLCLPIMLHPSRTQNVLPIGSMCADTAEAVGLIIIPKKFK